jgi:hypothetical protein
VGKDRRNLKGANNTAARRLCGFFAGDVDAVEGYTARCGRQKFGEQIEKSGFTRTIGANQRVNMTIWLTATNPLNSLVNP